MSVTRAHFDQQLHDLADEVVAMGELVRTTIGASVDALEAVDASAAQELIAADSHIDGIRYDIENKAFLLIATQQPAARDLRSITAMLTICTELERIGDYCEGIAKITLDMIGEPRRESLADIRSMAGITQQLLRDVLNAFIEQSLSAASVVWLRDDEVDALYEQVFRRLLSRMLEDRSAIRQGTYLLWVAHNLERMADRVTNIAERVAFIVTGDVTGFRSHLRAQTIPG